MRNIEQRKREREVDLSSSELGGGGKEETIGRRTKHLPGSLFHPSIVAVGTTRRSDWP